MVEAGFRAATGFGDIADRGGSITASRKQKRRLLQNEGLDIVVVWRARPRHGWSFDRYCSNVRTIGIDLVRCNDSAFNEEKGDAARGSPLPRNAAGFLRASTPHRR